MPLNLIKTLTCCLFISQAAWAVDLNSQLPSRLSEVKAGNKAIELLGYPVQLQQQAPDFKVVDDKFKTIQLSDFKGKTVLISVVPSVDTGICSLQTKRFNQEVSQVSDQVVMMTISTDLPFAQKRYCAQEKVEQLMVLSDAVWRDFGSNYGLLIKDMGILARAVLIIDSKGNLAYQQLVPVLAQEPDYAHSMAALAQITGKKS
ncbi:thiol peroxidase [Rheinheimera sediminis]|uniref:thiol peroxidase n=1 Tax=Rheinheimera sp. YQF-1 TaxID=2499626 RepID=UPI000FDB8628|nr:thiol peroxidase [Rheinheimera sp. YQF-1]RVT46233.1 thiol peroxidase [Rheinheimera sp. YQF-1]